MKPETQNHLIGAISIGGMEVMTKCVNSGMTPDWFTSPIPRWCYKAAMEMFANGKPIDAYTLKCKVEEQGGKDLTVELSQWGSDVPSMENVPRYLEMAGNEHKLDQAIRELEFTKNAVEKMSVDDASETIAKIQTRWAELGHEANEVMTLAKAAAENYKDWTTPLEDRERPEIKWPLKQLQDIIGSLEEEYVVIGARPSVGKTAFVVQWGLTLAWDAIISSLASLESSTKKVAMRAIAITGMVNTIHLRRRQNNETEDLQARNAVKKLQDCCYRVQDRGMNLDQLRAWAVGQKASGSNLLVIDNMKHIRTTERYSGENERFMDMSAKVKWIRDDVNLPVVLLHHLNKELEMSWSDAIERDVDVLIRMTDDDKNSQPPSADNHFLGRSIVKFDIMKNREGPRNIIVRGEFKKDIQTFEDWDV